MLKVWHFFLMASAKCSSVSRCYPAYVLFLLMITYLTNQTDRFVLGIASEKISADLSIGHEGCYPNLTRIQTNSSECNPHCQSKQNEEDCCSDDRCSWGYLSTGIRYQVLAGPAFIIVFALASLPMGLLASVQKLRRTLVLAISIFLWSGMTLLGGFALEYWQLVLSRFGLGIFQAACIPFASSLISDYFKRDFRGTALSLYSWGVYIGYSLAFAFNFIVEQDGWRWAFKIASFPGFLISALVLLTIKEPKRKHREHTEQHKTLIYSPKCYLLKRILSSYIQLPLLLLCIGAGLRQGGGLVWAYNAKSYFRLLHCDVHGVGVYISWVPVVGGSVGVVLGGFISDTLVKKWGKKTRIIVLAMSTLLSSPFLFGTLFLHTPLAFISLLFAYIVGEMWFGVCIAVAMDLVPPEVSSAAVSLYLFIVNIIGGNLNLLLPPLQSALGLQYSMVILFPGAYLLAGVFFILTGCFWRFRYLGPSEHRHIRSTDEQQGLIQDYENGGDPTDLLTESQEVEKRTSRSAGYFPLESSIS